MQRLTAKVKIGILAPIQEVFEALVNPEIMKNYFISKVSNRMEMKMQPTGKFKDVQTALANLEKIKETSWENYKTSPWKI